MSVPPECRSDLRSYSNCDSSEYCTDCGHCRKCDDESYSGNEDELVDDCVCTTCNYCSTCDKIATTNDEHCRHNICLMCESKNTSNRFVVESCCVYCIMDNFVISQSYCDYEQSGTYTDWYNGEWYDRGDRREDENKDFVHMMMVIRDIKIIATLDANENKEKYVPTWWKEGDENDNEWCNNIHKNMYRCYSDTYDLAQYRKSRAKNANDI